MARTFRLRHLPSLPGTAKRFAFTAGVSNWKTREKIILDTARKLFPNVFINLITTPSMRGRISYRQARDARSIVDTLENQIVVPLMAPYGHPWCRRRCYGLNLRKAKHFRIAAHRQIRRIAKNRLNHPTMEFDEMLMPLWYEHWDAWNID